MSIITYKTGLVDIYSGFGIIDSRFKIGMVIKSEMIGSLPKLIALLMVLLLVGSTFAGGIFYFLK